MNFASCLLEAHVAIPIYTVGGVTLACQQIYSLRFELGSYEELGFGALLAAEPLSSLVPSDGTTPRSVLVINSSL